MATQNGYPEGLTERWAGKLLRWLMAYVFVVGLFVLPAAVVYQHPGAAVSGAIMLVPYLVIRYRDPDSPLVPLAGYISQ